jgi:hypothetical protein
MTDSELFNLLNTAEEMNFQNWKMYRVLYNEELKKMERRIEELEKALDFYKCGCSKDKCTPEKPRFRSIKCGWIARAALEGKGDD